MTYHKKRMMGGEEKKSSFDVLKSLLLDKKSSLYLSKNTKQILNYLNDNGIIDIDKNTVKSFIQSQKSFNQVTNNSSKRRISEVSKSFILPEEYFRVLHSDILVLSKKKQYRSKNYYLLSLIDSLSCYVFVESIFDTKSQSIIKAFDLMIKRSGKKFPPGVKTIIADQGYSSLQLNQWAKNNSFIIKTVKYRPVRFSRGSSLSEQMNKRIRICIESLLVENPHLDHKKIVSLCEETLNKSKQNILGNISAIECINYQDPKYIKLLKISNRIRKRKYLRKEMLNSSTLPLYSVVRIRLNKTKSFFQKESYGVFSDSLFLIIKKIQSNFVTYYKLGSLNDMKAISEHTYSKYELLLTSIPYEKACYINSINHPKFVRNIDNNMIEYRVQNENFTFVAHKSILSLKS